MGTLENFQPTHGLKYPYIAITKFDLKRFNHIPYYLIKLKFFKKSQNGSSMRAADFTGLSRLYPTGIEPYKEASTSFFGGRKYTMKM